MADCSKLNFQALNKVSKEAMKDKTRIDELAKKRAEKGGKSNG